jgi:hypothetical protein
MTANDAQIAPSRRFPAANNAPATMPSTKGAIGGYNDPFGPSTGSDCLRDQTYALPLRTKGGSHIPCI